MIKWLFKIIAILFLCVAVISAVLFIKMITAMYLAAIEFNIAMVFVDILAMFITLVCSLAFAMFSFVMLNENK
jgi:hypothetical protein